MKWILSLAHELGGPQKAADMIAGKGISLILNQIDLRFRRPVTYPDTVRLSFLDLWMNEFTPKFVYLTVITCS